MPLVTLLDDLDVGLIFSERGMRASRVFAECKPCLLFAAETQWATSDEEDGAEAVVNMESSIPLSTRGRRARLADVGRSGSSCSAIACSGSLVHWCASLIDCRVSLVELPTPLADAVLSRFEESSVVGLRFRFRAELSDDRLCVALPRGA